MMLRHVVMMKFNEKEPLKAVANEMKQRLTELTKEIDELKAMEVGLNVNTKPSAFDLVLIADFDDENGLNAYRVHPFHQKVLDRMKEVVAKTAVTDYFL